MILHIDTETTGLNLHGIPSDDVRQPHMVSLSCVLDDAAGKTQAILSTLIIPEGHVIDERMAGDDGGKTAFSIHGITNATAKRYGVPLHDVLADFGSMVRRADIISGFNIFFDFKMLKIGCARTGIHGEKLRELMESRTGLCTMETAAAHLIGKKRISLKNAYFEMFKEEIQTGLHGSFEDVMASRRIYWELVRRGHPMEPKSLARKEYDAPMPVAAQ